MKGYELIKEITERKIKNNAKIKVKIGDTYKVTLKYENLMLKWESGDFDTSILCSTEANFEVIEENKEIKELYEHKTINYTQTDIRANREKINELVREVNKIKKQLEEQETEDIDTVERELNKMFKEEGKSKHGRKEIQ